MENGLHLSLKKLIDVRYAPMYNILAGFAKNFSRHEYKR